MKEDNVILRSEKGEISPELYSYYENLPAFKAIYVPKGFDDPPVRYAIMRILSEGIIDDSADTQEKKQHRHALNAREIEQMLKKHKNPEVSKISYTNLYFHLNKLLEIGAIKVAALVIERNHRITYYGRTAHVVLKRDPETELQRYQEMFTEFGKLAKLLRPETNLVEFKSIAERYHKFKSKRQEDIAKWLADNEAIIRRENLDFLLIDKFLLLVDTLNSGYKELLKDFTEFLP
ncbi:MAG: hypothetical protein ACXAC7_20975 [Candidatus Hodarchaeales archaeon]|jgi:DNA-binding transcriptional ArsR family regulator